MKSEVLSNFDAIWLPTTALILFFTVFVGVSFILWNKNSQEKLKESEALPFDEGIKK